MAVRGKFIVIEGMDGTGKSTQAGLLATAISATGVKLIRTREPGGTPTGEKLRELILNNYMSKFAELCLHSAARNMHVQDVIEPALARGDWVMSDRYYQSTIAYQGYGRGFNRLEIALFNRLATRGLKPDLALIFMLDPEIAASRRAARGGPADVYEKEELQFFQRVHKGYQACARFQGKRVALIDAAKPVEQVKADVWRVAQERLNL